MATQSHGNIDRSCRAEGRIGRVSAGENLRCRFRHELETAGAWRYKSEAQRHLLRQPVNADMRGLVDMAVADVPIEFRPVTNIRTHDSIEAELQICCPYRMGHKKIDRLVDGELEVRAYREPEARAFRFRQNVEFYPERQRAGGAAGLDQAGKRKQVIVTRST